MSCQNPTASPEFQRPSGGLLNRRPKAVALLQLALISLALLALQPSTAQAQAPLTDDASVSLQSGNANHGANPNLQVSSSRNVYLKFKLTTLPETTLGSEVEKATLKIYAGKIKSAGKLDVYAVVGEWDERTINAGNAPPLGSLVTTTGEIVLDHEGKFLTIDITALVQQWLGDDGQGANGLPNNGVAILAHPHDQANDGVVGLTHRRDHDPPGGADLTFDSKENSQTSHEAQLNIQLRRAGGLQQVATDASLRGDGTGAAPLGVATGGIDNVHLADSAVTGAKIADGAVTSSELADAAVAGAKIADGAVSSAKIALPLSLTSADPAFTLSVANTGSGAAITAAGAIDTSKQYNIGGQHILSNPGTNNIFAGTDAGASNTTGLVNAFFGRNAGKANTTGSSNSFVGFNAGAGNTTGGNNSFVGDAAGFRNAAGRDNSFFGFLAGFHNTASNNSYFGSFAGANSTTGSQNSFFGVNSGVGSTTGSFNAFFGVGSGLSNTTGGFNTFVGYNASVQINTTGNNLTILGAFARVGVDNLSFATAIGAGAVVSASNSLVLGRIPDNVGIGTPAPRAKLHLANGRIYVEANGQGVILKAPSGACFELTVTDAGALTTAPITCP